MNWTKHFTISTINKTSHHHLLAAWKSKLTFINTREMWYVGKQVCCVREVWETKMHFSWVYYDILTRFFARSRTIFRNQSSLIVSKKSRWNAIRVFNLTFCMQVKKATRKRKNHTVKKTLTLTREPAKRHRRRLLTTIRFRVVTTISNWKRENLSKENHLCMRRE